MLQISKSSPLTGTYDLHSVPTISEGGHAQFSMTVTGAVVGDIVDTSMPQPHTYGVAALASAEVISANTVQVFISALYGGSDVSWDTGQTFTARIARY